MKRFRSYIGWALILCFAAATYATNPTTMLTGGTSGGPRRIARLLATTTEQFITLDKDCEWAIGHDGLNTSLVADTENILLAFDGATNNDNEGHDKATLTSTRVITIGPGVATLGYMLPSGSAGAPMFTIVRGPNLNNNW